MTPHIRRRLFIAGALAIAALLVFLRPGLERSPWAMLRLFHADVRVENFRHMERIFPAATLARSTQPKPLPQGEAILPATYEFSGEKHHLGDFLTRTDTTGLMVLKHGVVVHEEYRLGATPESRFTSWSVAKSVVATLVGVALKDGKIHSLDDRVVDYVPDYRGTAWENVRIRDLLRMSSGIRFNEEYFAQFSDIQRVMQETFVLRRPIDEAIRDYPAAAEEQPPGSRFHYISIDTEVLANVLRHATGQPLLAYAHDKLWQPLGMEDDALWNTDTHGTPIGFCCLNTTLRDYARIGLLYSRNGVHDGVQLLPEDWVRESTQRTEPWLQPGVADGPRGYGYHWWVPPAADGEFFAFGIWGQTVWVDTRDDVVIVRMAADPAFEEDMDELIAALRSISRELVERPAEAPGAQKVNN